MKNSHKFKTTAQIIEENRENNLLKKMQCLMVHISRRENILTYDGVCQVQGFFLANKIPL